MPSLIPGYQYDIFISYRHNDNRSGWVTDFVNALQEELATTIKEPLSIYFDKNPHDGLLETHDVDESLKDKLKCLIFIPVISQTYCDPKCFSWNSEFLAFKKIAGEDSFGPKVKLHNGNVASRILLVRIHELDNEDKSLLEQELNGPVRAIEFIYQEAGVNRPLTKLDSRNLNWNKTDYRNQINRTSSAIKEIILALKRPVNYPHISQSEKVPNHHYSPSSFSIAVLPFVNISNDPEQKYFSEGLSEELLHTLSKLPELKVAARTSSFSLKKMITTFRQ